MKIIFTKINFSSERGGTGQMTFQQEESILGIEKVVVSADCIG